MGALFFLVNSFSFACLLFPVFPLKRVLKNSKAGVCWSLVAFITLSPVGLLADEWARRSRDLPNGGQSSFRDASALELSGLLASGLFFPYR